MIVDRKARMALPEQIAAAQDPTVRRGNWEEVNRGYTLMQAQADLLQAPVRVYHSPDATALGAAAFARLGAGAAESVAEAVGPAELATVADASALGRAFDAEVCAAASMTP